MYKRIFLEFEIPVAVSARITEWFNRNDMAESRNSENSNVTDSQGSDRTGSNQIQIEPFFQAGSEPTRLFSNFFVDYFRYFFFRLFFSTFFSIFFNRTVRFENRFGSILPLSPAIWTTLEKKRKTEWNRIIGAKARNLLRKLPAILS